MKESKEMTVYEASLEACPFCGSERIVIDTLKGYKRIRFRAQCGGCAASTGWHPTEQGAAGAWHSRETAAQARPAPSPRAWRTAVYP
jgi:hypothetical protein